MEPIHTEVSTTAPAKINLGLRVCGRRSDGYHELESLFVPLDLQDDLRVTVRAAAASSVLLAVSESGTGRPGKVPADASNLAHRAASGFLAAAGLKTRVELHLSKRIPAGAGLGGGSSDAGAVLRVLDGIFPGALEPAELARLALALGADVPFFLDPRPARVAGIGERIEPLEDLPRFDLVLCHPGEPLSTREVFRAFDALSAEPTAGGALTPSEVPPTMRAPVVGPGPATRVADLLNALRSGSGSELTNDLEPAAVRLCPAISRLRECLGAAGARTVGMSGSGATLFGVFDGPQEARKALENITETQARAGESPRRNSGQENSGPEFWARVATTIQSR